MKIGSFGNLIFETSSSKILSFPNLSRSSSSRVEKHEIGGTQPIVEFVGPGEDNITFELTLARHLGVDPAIELEKLRTMKNTGMRYPLIIGGAPIGGGGALWMITELGDEIITDNKGVVLSAQVNVSMTLAPNPPNVVPTAGNVSKANVKRRRPTA